MIKENSKTQPKINTRTKAQLIKQTNKIKNITANRMYKQEIKHL